MFTQPGHLYASVGGPLNYYYFFFSHRAVIPTHRIRKDKTDQQASKHLSVFGRDFIKLEYSIRDSTPFSSIFVKRVSGRLQEKGYLEVHALRH